MSIFSTQVVVVRARRDRRLERVEIDDEQIDRRDAMREHRRLVLGVFADREQAAVHLRMQRLHAAVHHLRKAREIADIDDGEASGDQRLACSAGRDEFDAALGQRAAQSQGARSCRTRREARA